MGFGRTSPRRGSPNGSPDSVGTPIGCCGGALPPPMVPPDEERPVPLDTARFGAAGYLCSAARGDAKMARRLAFTRPPSCSLPDPQPRIPVDPMMPALARVALDRGS